MSARMLPEVAAATFSLTRGVVRADALTRRLAADPTSLRHAARLRRMAERD